MTKREKKVLIHTFYTPSNTSPYSDSYLPPYTSSYSNSYTRLNARIQEYRTLIQACQEAMRLEGEVLFNIEKVTHTDLKKHYRKFACTSHPDKGEDTEKFRLGKDTWEALENQLKDYGFILQDLKNISQGLLECLQTPPQ